MVIKTRELLAEVNKRLGNKYRQRDVNLIYDTIKNTVIDYLREANPLNSVTVKLSTGLSLTAKEKPSSPAPDFVPERTIASRMWVYPRVSRYFNRKSYNNFEE